MKRILISLFLVSLSVTAFTQEATNETSVPLEKIERQGFGYVQGDTKIKTWGQIRDIYKADGVDTAVKKLNASQFKIYFSFVPAIAGGLIISVPLLQLINNEDPNLLFAGVGIGSFAGALFLTISGQHDRDESIRIYNEYVDKKNSEVAINWAPIVTPNKVGLLVSFSY
ncbi:hypothetical protein [Spirochaeta cellobiosiphila]|uniref:hypothetical protein n=1 Tax=Spirochaeta cellobiosiphila TaxID=504483 RepID=UPI0004193A1F|nr:hypothetical protein [Spirochaeta cellobiosiphila]